MATEVRTLLVFKEAPDALQKLQHSKKETNRWIIAFEEKKYVLMLTHSCIWVCVCVCVLWPFISYHVSFCCFIAKWEFNIGMGDSLCLFTIQALWFPCLFFWSSPLLRVCMCKEGALSGLDIFLKKKKKNKNKKKPHKRDFLFMPVANCRADPWDSAVCFFFHLKSSCLWVFAICSRTWCQKRDF